MNKPSGLASKLRALLKAKETPMWGVIIVLVIVIIFQQIQLQWLHPELKVQPPEANPSPFKSTDLNLDMNPGKVPDVTK